MIKDSNVRGILLMIASMIIFSVVDTLIKMSTAMLSTSQVMFFLLCGSGLLFATIAKLQGDSLKHPKAFAPVLLLRYFVEVTGMLGMVTALEKIPLSTVGAITQATPIFAAICAALFLGERVGWRRWLSIIVGFIGVLLIVQPGAVAFDINVLWAVLALVALSIRDLTTRMVPADMPSATLATYTMAGAIPATIIWVLFNGESFFPAQANWFIVIPMVALGSLAYLLLIASLRMAEVSVVMPFRYTRVIFLVVIGMVFFEEIPDTWTIMGAMLIVVSGIYIMWREQQLKKHHAR